MHGVEDLQEDGAIAAASRGSPARITRAAPRPIYRPIPVQISTSRSFKCHNRELLLVWQSQCSFHHHTRGVTRWDGHPCGGRRPIRVRLENAPVLQYVTCRRSIENLKTVRTRIPISIIGNGNDMASVVVVVLVVDEGVSFPRLFPHDVMFFGGEEEQNVLKMLVI